MNFPGLGQIKVFFYSILSILNIWISCFLNNEIELLAAHLWRQTKLNFVYISDTKVFGSFPFFFILQCAIFPCQLFNFCLNSPVVFHQKEPQHSKAGKVTWKSVCAATVVKYQYLVLAYWFYLTETDSSLLLIHYFDSPPLYTLLPFFWKPIFLFLLQTAFSMPPKPCASSLCGNKTPAVNPQGDAHGMHLRGQQLPLSSLHAKSSQWGTTSSCLHHQEGWKRHGNTSGLP